MIIYDHADDGKSMCLFTEKQLLKHNLSSGWMLMDDLLVM